MTVLSVQNISSNLNILKYNRADRTQNHSKKMYVGAASDTVSFGSYPANFAEVIVGKLFRGAKPTMGELKTLRDTRGVKYVFDLLASEEESQMAKELGMIHVPFELPDVRDLKNLVPKIKEGVKKINELMKDGAVYVHCQLGQERTGYLIASCQKEVQPIADEQIIGQAQTHGLSKVSANCLSFFIKSLGVGA